VLLSIALGVVGDRLFPTRPSMSPAVLSSLPGRHLEPPWWEMTTIRTTANETTYVIPSDVLFATASSAVSSHGRADLLRLIPVLHGAGSVIIAGCTDSIGGVDSTYNVNLSQLRANAAVAVLVQGGLPSTILHTLAWADTHPAVTSSGLDRATINALNRRIVIIATKSEGTNA
jgi:flagellar motor protein MotB